MNPHYPTSRPPPQGIPSHRKLSHRGVGDLSGTPAIASLPVGQPRRFAARYI